MEKRVFGKTDLRVTPLGFGSCEIGVNGTPVEAHVDFLNSLLDYGINFIDTASCYGNAEEKIGRSIAHRRKEFVLVTKCGHNAEKGGPADWENGIVEYCVAKSLRRMKTDYLDAVLLHSCDLEVLKEGKHVRDLEKCKQKGMTRFIGFSGDNEVAREAIDMNVFDCIEVSPSICDQQILDFQLPLAIEKNLGIIIKRPIANAPWLGAIKREGFNGDVRPYIERLKKMGFTPDSLGFDGSWLSLALRFAAFQPGVHTMIVGTTKLKHIKENIAIIEQGPLPVSIVENIREIWKEKSDDSWTGQN